MDPTHTITLLVNKLRSDHRPEFQAAAGEIWARYSGRLLDVARRQLSPRVRRREGEEDLLQSMYKSFCLRQQRGLYAIDNRDDLWNLLVAITENKAANLAKHHSRQRRDMRREQQPAMTPDGDELADAMGIADRGPSPDEAAILNQELQQRLEQLSPELRRLALWKLEGWTNEEIAAPDKMDCAVRTVERKLALIRGKWEPASADHAD